VIAARQPERHRRLGPAQVARVGRGRALDRVGLAQVRLRFGPGGGLQAGLLARLQPAQRLGLDGVADVGPARCEQGDADDQQAEQRQRVVADLEQTMAGVAQKNGARAGDRGPPGSGERADLHQ
jgi:hypothetical protein